MKNYAAYPNEINNKRISIFGFLLSIFIIYLSGYALSTKTTVLNNLMLIVPTVLLLFIEIIKLKKLKISINVYNLSVISYLLFIIIAAFVNFNISYIGTTIKYFMTVLFAYLITRRVRLDDFLHYFIRIMKFIILISLLMYFIRNVLNIHLNLPVFNNVNNVTYKNAIVYFIIEDLPSRNTGLFWEPGLFASYILLSMTIEIIFFNERINYLSIITYFLGLLSTKSTAGLLLFPLAIIILIFKNKNGFKSAIVAIFLIIAVIFVYFNIDIIIKMLVNFNREIFNKLVIESSSSTVRSRSILGNLNIFLDYPIFGAGVGKSDSIYFRDFRISQTSTSFYYLASFGIFGIYYTLFWIIGILKMNNLNFILKITFLTLILIIVNKEPHSLLVATQTLQFYLLKQISLSRQCRNYS